jgi:hypothetical protein
MQHSKDYLLRDIEKLSLMLIGLVEKVRGSNANTTSEELEEINTALQSQLDLSLEKISKMKADEFKNHISTLHETHLEQLAELLYQLVLKSDLLELNQGFSTSKTAKKAILLIDALNEKSKTFSIERLEMREQMKGFIA